MARSLGFYLDLGCEVRRAADGWALLCCGQTSFVLIQTVPGAPLSRPAAAAAPQLRVDAPDVRALRRRLLAAGIPVGAITRPSQTPAGEIETMDPDQHLVVIAQPGPRTTTTNPATRALTLAPPRHVHGH